MNYLDVTQAENRNNNETLFEPTIIYFDKIVVTDMYGRRYVTTHRQTRISFKYIIYLFCFSWHYCKPNTKMEDTTGQQYGLLTLTLSKTVC